MVLLGLGASILDGLEWGKLRGNQSTVSKQLSRALERPEGGFLRRSGGVQRVISRLVTPRLMMEEREFLSLTYSLRGAANSDRSNAAPTSYPTGASFESGPVHLSSLFCLQPVARHSLASQR